HPTCSTTCSLNLQTMTMIEIDGDALARRMLERVLHPKRFGKHADFEAEHRAIAERLAENAPSTLREGVAFLMYASGEQRASLASQPLAPSTVWALKAARELISRVTAGEDAVAVSTELMRRA